jgi:hypothetical protein
MYRLYKNDHAKTTYVGLPVTFRQIYLFLITISSLDLKYFFLKPVRLVMSGFLRVQTMLVLFTFSNSMLKEPVL